MEDAVFRASGKTVEYPGFLLAYVEDDDGDADAKADRARAPAARDGRRARHRRARARGPRDAAAPASHGGRAHQGARGARHRASEHLRLDHRDDPRARLLLQEGHGPRPDVHRVRRRPAPRAPPPPPRGLRVHGEDGGRARRDQQRDEEGARLPRGLLQRQRPPGTQGAARDGRRRDRPGRGLPRDALPGHRHRGPRRALRAVHRAGQGRGPRQRHPPRRDPARRAHRGARARDPREGRPGPEEPRQRPGVGPRDLRQGRAVRPLRPARHARGRGQEGQAQDGVPARGDDARRR